MQHVSGMGIYIRRLAPKGKPAKVAQIAARHGVTHMQILGAWQEPDKRGRVRTSAANRKVIGEYTAAFAEQGIACGLWFYPWAGHEARLLDVLNEQCQTGLITSLLNDAELGYKWCLGKPSNAREAVKSVTPTLDKSYAQERASALVEGVSKLAADMPYGHGFTSYGVRTFHPNFPWEQFGECDFYSPQLYRSSRNVVHRGLTEWAAMNAGKRDIAILPSIGAFGPKSKSEMSAHVAGFLDSRNPNIAGFLVWSWMQVDRDEWGTIEQWAKWLRDRASS